MVQGTGTSADGPEDRNDGRGKKRSKAGRHALVALNALPQLQSFLEMNFKAVTRCESGDPIPMESVYRAIQRSGRLYIKARFQSLPGVQPRLAFEFPLIRLSPSGGRRFNMELNSGGANWFLLEEDRRLDEVFRTLLECPHFLQI